MTHGGDDCETVSWQRHLKVGEQNIELLYDNLLESLVNAAYRNDFKTFGFQASLHHFSNSIIVISQ